MTAARRILVVALPADVPLQEALAACGVARRAAQAEPEAFREKTPCGRGARRSAVTNSPPTPTSMPAPVATRPPAPPPPPIDDGRRAERLAACEDCKNFLELDYATPACKLIRNAQQRPCVGQYAAYLLGTIPPPAGCPLNNDQGGSSHVYE